MLFIQAQETMNTWYVESPSIVAEAAAAATGPTHTPRDTSSNSNQFISLFGTRKYIRIYPFSVDGIVLLVAVNKPFDTKTLLLLSLSFYWDQSALCRLQSCPLVRIRHV